jgi:cell division GTPase FtsZ
MDGYQHGVIEEFTEDLTEQIADTLDQADDKTVFALSGVGTLFGVSSVSTVVEKLAPKVYGRLVVFFPGQVENNNYRLLDARDGWNYLAVNITAA